MLYARGGQRRERYLLQGGRTHLSSAGGGVGVVEIFGGSLGRITQRRHYLYYGDGHCAFKTCASLVWKRGFVDSGRA